MAVPFRRQWLGAAHGLLANRKAWAVIAVLLASTYKATVGLPLALWHDEALVATSVLEPTWKEMFFFSRYAQSSLGYLAALRLAGQALGYSEPALRDTRSRCSS